MGQWFFCEKFVIESIEGVWNDTLSMEKRGNTMTGYETFNSKHELHALIFVM